MLKHHGAQGDVVAGVNTDRGGFTDLLESEDLHGAGDESLRVVSEQVLVQLAVIDNGLDDETATGTASNDPGVRAAAPHVHVVSGQLRAQMNCSG